MTGHVPDKTYCDVSDVPRPGSEFADQVSAMLGRRVRGLRIEVRDGGLVLCGRANSYHAKQLAEHAVLAVSELPLLVNEIVATRDSSVPDTGA